MLEYRRKTIALDDPRDIIYCEIYRSISRGKYLYANLLLLFQSNVIQGTNHQ